MLVMAMSIARDPQRVVGLERRAGALVVSVVTPSNFGTVATGAELQYRSHGGARLSAQANRKVQGALIRAGG